MKDFEWRGGGVIDDKFVWRVGALINDDRRGTTTLSYLYPRHRDGGPESLPIGWVMPMDDKWVVRTASSLRGEFDNEEEAKAFLLLLASTGN